jgi:hypothetical protein
LELKECGNFSFKAIEQINPPPSKIFLKKSQETNQILLPIFMDLFVEVEIDFILWESLNYEFELFKFYQNVSQKLKY